MVDLATVVGIAGNLLGGLFGNKSAKKAAAQERAWALEDQAEQFVRLRAAAEKAGFNPLTALGAAPYSGMVNATPAASNAYMGTAIADSALMMADSLAKTRAAAMGRSVEDLNRQKNILTRKLRDATLRPKVGGVYDGARTFGTGAANAGTSGLSRPTGSNSVAAAGRGDSRMAGTLGRGGQPLLEVDPIDPRRAVDNRPVNTTSGFLVVDNPWTGRAYIPTLDGEEPLGGEMAGPLWLGPQLAFNGGSSLTFGGGSESRPSMTREEALRRKAEREKAKPSYPTGRQFWTHEWTGFSAPRHFGAY